MTDATFTFRVDDDLKNKFTSAAKSRDRSGAQLLRDFMREFVNQQQVSVDDEESFRRQVQIGIDSAKAGELVSYKDVEALFAARRTASVAKEESSE